MKIYKIYKIAAPTPYDSSIIDRYLSNPMLIPLSDPFVLTAITILRDMGVRGVNDAASFTSFSGGAAGTYGSVPFANGLAYIDTFYRARSGINSEIDKVLGRLITIGGHIVNTNIGTPSGFPYSAAMKNALTSIYNYFGGKGFETTRTEQYPMFTKLLQRFSIKISSSATAAGDMALATAISGEALLEPTRLVSVIKLEKTQSQMFDTANELIDGIFKKHDGKYITENFNVVKETLMRYFGFISAEQRRDVEKARKEKEFMGGSSSSVAPVTTPPAPPGGTPPPLNPSVATPYKPTRDQWLNSGFITALMVFFNQYRNRLSKLPS